MNSNAVIFLAAGKQTRFGGSRPKCMSLVGKKPIIQHAVEAWPGRDLYIVVSDLWGYEDIEFVKSLGFTVTHPVRENIGMSIVAGLEACREHEYEQIAVVSADTLFLSELAYLEERSKFLMVFDPIEWVTVWLLDKNSQDPLLFADTDGRVEFAAEHGWYVAFASESWINVNTQDDLRRARALYEQCYPSK
jgi:molybdopterin-guanine dinucleotide biosynthesis protein A